MTSAGWALIQQDWGPYKKLIQTCTEARPYEDQKEKKNGGHQMKTSKKSTLLTPSLGLPASRNVRKYISVVSVTQAMILGYDNPYKLIHS